MQVVGYPYKRQPYKMVKHSQTIRWQKPTNCLSVFDHFWGLVLKGLKGDSGGFRRRKNLEQFITFKQSNFVNVFVFFSYFEILAEQSSRLGFEIRLVSLSSVNYANKQTSSYFI